MESEATGTVTVTTPMDQEGLVDLTMKSWERLIELWKVYGHGEESLEKRKKCVYKYSHELYADMIGEEERRIVEKKSEIMKLRLDIDSLAKELSEPPYEVQVSSLLDEQSALEKKVEELQKLKAKKMEVWITLREIEKALCGEIGENLSEDHVGIPNDKGVAELKALINTLENEKKQRLAKYLTIKQSVAVSMGLVEKAPITSVEKDILGPTLPILSLNFLKDAAHLQSDLISQIEVNKENARATWTRIKALWNRLEIAEELKAAFEESHTGYRPSVLEKLRTEFSRLEVLKQANLAKFISRVRDEIMSHSNLVFKRIELPEEVVSEECLVEHERILENLKIYASDNAKVIELFNKRNEMWKEWKEYEARAEDPNRLNNRGGGLLREEKIRRTLEKKLPQIEKEIDAESKGFEIYGVDVMELLRMEMEEHSRDKEDRKAEKKKKTATEDKTVMNMNMTRKRPMTPAGGVTPGKRNKLMPFNKVVPTTPRTRAAAGLKNHLVSPAKTYTDFASHQIFQSTLNNGNVPCEQASTGSTPKKIESTPMKGALPRKDPNKKLFMTPTMHL